jgi:hypothetical protein
MTTWQKPAFEELAMNAEIGAYQADDDERDNRPFLQARGPAAETAPEPSTEE